MQANRVVIVPAPDRELDLSSVPRAIRGAGFRPSDFHVRGVATIEASTPGCLRFRGWTRCYEVEGSGADRKSPSEIQARVEERDGRTVLELDRS